MNVEGPLPFLDDIALTADEGVIRAAGNLSRGDAIYAGHFPGQPILPAIAQLEILRSALAAVLGYTAALVEIKVLKLRQILVPGQGIEVEIGAEEADGARRFTLRAAAATVSSGSIRSAMADRGEEMVDSPLLPPRSLEDDSRVTLLPHTPPARLVSGIDSVDGEQIFCIGLLPNAHALVRNGWAPSFVGLEAAAQAAGLLESLRHPIRREESAVGYIVGMRDVVLSPAPLASDLPFRVTARHTGGAGSLSVYEVEATGNGGVPYARGTLSAFLPQAASQHPE